MTLVELLVAISIIVMLAAIMVPVVQRTRENARDASCKNNLRQFGVGLNQYATNHATFCSGAFDWKRDGCVTEVGWVADMVNAGTPVGDLLCPSSPYQLSRQIIDLLTEDPTDNPCAKSIGTRDQILPNGTRVKNACKQLVEAGSLGDRVPIVEELILEPGFNSNYAATWFLVRSEVELDARGNMKNRLAGCEESLLSRGTTVGPLPRAKASSATAAPTNRIPLMGCANSASPIAAAMLPVDVGEHRAGTMTCESVTGGPVETDSMQPPSFSGSATGMAAWWETWNATLQDYRQLGPVHGAGRKRGCNILFLDGSVRNYSDENGDGMLNNGFPATAASGFADDAVELPAAEVYSGWSLTPARVGR